MLFMLSPLVQTGVSSLLLLTPDVVRTANASPLLSAERVATDVKNNPGPESRSNHPPFHDQHLISSLTRAQPHQHALPTIRLSLQGTFHLIDILYCLVPSTSSCNVYKSLCIRVNLDFPKRDRPNRPSPSSPSTTTLSAASSLESSSKCAEYEEEVGGGEGEVLERVKGYVRPIWVALSLSEGCFSNHSNWEWDWDSSPSL
ncbi:hypothetical protein FB446DRAFT_405666 [Lentinula raphanica]|nr:hypothetical protein FB446DRAFT_405666 [Lentinula raphanica]